MTGKTQSRQEYQVSFRNICLSFSSVFPRRFRSDRGSFSYISLLLVAQIIYCKCSFSCKIYNGNRTEWSRIRSVITGVITKSDLHLTRVQS